MVTLAWIILGASGGSRGRRSAHWVWLAWTAMEASMNRSTWLLARAIWVSFFVVCLVFFGLELVFRILDEAKLPHTNYTAEEIAWVSLSGMARRLYLDLPLMVLIAGRRWTRWIGPVERINHLKNRRTEYSTDFFEDHLGVVPHSHRLHCGCGGRDAECRTV